MLTDAQARSMATINTMLMPSFKKNTYRVVVLDASNDLPTGAQDCLYYGQIPSDAKALILIDRTTGRCASSIVMAPWMIDATSIEISSKTADMYQRKGLNMFLRVLAILLTKTFFPEATRMISYAESPISQRADRRLGFVRTADQGVTIYELPITPETVASAVEVLVQCLRLDRQPQSYSTQHALRALLQHIPS